MNKLKAKLNQVEEIIKADDFYTKYNTDQRLKYLRQRNDLQFKINKENIYVRLTGSDRYYYANQCAKFTKYVLSNGIKQYKASDIADVSFHTHCITVRFHSTAESDIQRFETKKEMLGYVAGFNACSSEVA